MKKLIIIMAIITGVLIITCVLGYFFLRGTLVIKATPSPYKVALDGKNYNSSEVFSKNILIGPHQVTVKKDFYNDFPLDIWIDLNQIHEENVSLSLNQDGQAILEKSTKIANAWIDFTRTKNNNLLLETIAPFTNSDIVDSLKILISQAGTTNSTGVSTEIQQVYGPIKEIKLEKDGENGAKATVNVQKRAGNDLSVSALVINYSKDNGNWIANNITYNY